MPTRLLIVLVFCVAIWVPAAAQSKSSDVRTAKTAREKTAGEIAAEQLLKERRANAQSLLITLAVDARTFNDDRVRARTQATIADLLWESDRERSRSIFLSAWEAAEAADAKSREQMQQEIREQQARTGTDGFVVAFPPTLRREVLELAARRDRALSEGFRTRYNEQRALDAAADRNRQPNPASTDAATQQPVEGASKASNNPREREADTPIIEIETAKPSADREQSLLDQRDRAKTAAERDQISLQLAMLMVDLDDRRARDYVDKIDEMELRDVARGYIDLSIAWKVVEKKNVDRALELVRTGELTHFQKAWLLARTASFADKRDRYQLMSLIDDAAAEARRIETSDPDRPRAFLAIANVVFNLNRTAIWETMDEVMRASNSSETFTGSDGQMTFRLSSKGTNAVHQHAFPDFDIAGIFSKLANQDYDRAVGLARGFQHEAPRANAVIAIARSVLEEKKN